MISLAITTSCEPCYTQQKYEKKEMREGERENLALEETIPCEHRDKHKGMKRNTEVLSPKTPSKYWQDMKANGSSVQQIKHLLVVDLQE